MFRYLFTPRHTTSSLFPDGLDMHTHILWGVDDGASSLQESLGIIRRLKSFGLRGAYCTPHIKACYPENTPDFLRRRFEQLLASVTNEQFELKLAAEYMLDDRFEEQINRYAPLTYDGTHLLVELPQHYLPGTWKDMFTAIRDKGYAPVLAHPERYGRLLPQEELLDLSQKEKVKFQGNVGSLGGFYGKSAAARAKDLFSAGIYSWWGTDSHSAAMAGRMPLKI